MNRIERRRERSLIAGLSELERAIAGLDSPSPALPVYRCRSLIDQLPRGFSGEAAVRELTNLAINAHDRESPWIFAARAACNAALKHLSGRRASATVTRIGRDRAVPED